MSMVWSRLSEMRRRGRNSSPEPLLRAELHVEDGCIVLGHHNKHQWVRKVCNDARKQIGVRAEYGMSCTR